MREGLDPWSFIYAAYALSVAGTALLTLQSWRAMRRAETLRERSREQ